MRISKLVTTTLILTAVPLANADIVEIDQFVGDYFDGFGQNDQGATQVLSVFEGNGTLSNLTEDGAIKLESSSNFNGDLVTPLSAPLMVGQIGIGRWDFIAPAMRFGGFFENNSGVDDATIFFYDENHDLIDSFVLEIPTAGGIWNWHGWESDTPFSRIEISGNGIFNGFLWFDNMQLTSAPVPAPASGATILFACLACSTRRRVAP